MKLNPKEFDLSARTLLEQMDDNLIVIVMNRKSRIIMADGKRILEKARKIKKVRRSITVALKTTAPLCSKTVRFLEDEGICLLP